MAETQNAPMPQAAATEEAATDNEMQLGGSALDYSQIPMLETQPKMVNPLTENLDDNWDVSDSIAQDTQWVIGDFNMPELRIKHDAPMSMSYLMGLGANGEAFEIESQPYGTEPAKPTDDDGGIVAMLGQGVTGALAGFKEISKIFGDQYPDRIERLFPFLLAAQTPALLSGEDPANLIPPERNKEGIAGPLAYEIGRIGAGFGVGGPAAASMKLAKNIKGLGAVGTNLLRLLSSGFSRSMVSGGIAEAVTLPADEKSMVDEFLTPYISSLGDDEKQSLANTLIDTYTELFAKDPESSELINDLRVFNAGTVEGAAADALIRGLMFGIKKIGLKRLLTAGGLVTGAFAGSEAEAGPISPLLEVFGLGPDALGFYSKAAREVDQVAQESMPVEAWRSYLFEGKQPRMRKEEWEWLGMDEFFSRPRNRDTIDKDDILQHIRANQLVIEEERLAGGSVDEFGETGEAYVFVSDEAYNPTAEQREYVARLRNANDTSYAGREEAGRIRSALNAEYNQNWSRGNLLAGDIEVSTVDSGIETFGDIDLDAGEYGQIVEFVNYEKKPKRDGITNDIRNIFNDFGDVEARRSETDLAEEYGDLSGEVTNEDFVDSLRTQVQTAGAPLFPDTPITTPNGAVLTREQALQIIDDYDTGMDPSYVTYLRLLENAEDGEAFGQVLREIQESFFSDIEANDALYEILHRQSSYRIDGVAGVIENLSFEQYADALEEAQNLLRENVQRQVDTLNRDVDAVAAAADAGDDEFASEVIHGRAKWDSPAYRTPGGKNYREFALRFADEQGITPAARMGDERFREAHFGKGVFAHARMSEHQVLGDKTYTVEEVQSSQHQQGYAKGYKRADKPRQFEEPFEAVELPTSPGFYEVQDANGRFITNVLNDPDEITGRTRSVDRAIEVARTRIAEGTPVGGADLGVPDAPFKTTWHEFTLKRLITDAVERGYDRIAWTPEAVQTERYGSAAVPDLYKLIYEQRMPQWTKKWLKKTDPDVKLETTDVGTKEGYFTFKLTDKIKNAVQQGNFELFAVGTPIAAALTAIQTGGMFVPEDDDMRGGLTKQQYIAARRQAIAEGRSQGFVDRHFPVLTEPKQPPQQQPVY